MPTTDSLMSVYEGWDGYNQSLVQALSPLTREQLTWRPSPRHRSVGEIVRHICMGRLRWFWRMGAPGSDELVKRIKHWETDSDGNQEIIEEALEIAEETAELLPWLAATWLMVYQTLTSWEVSDLQKVCRYKMDGQVYALSHQWTIWRIMAHDIHHGGELSLMLGLQGIDTFELGASGGLIIVPPLVKKHHAKRP